MRFLWQQLRWWLLGLLVAGLLLWRGLLWWTEWLWFQSVGYQPVFLKVWVTRNGLLAAGAALGLLVLVGNFLYSRRLDDEPSWARPDIGTVTSGPLLWTLMPAVLAVVAVVFGVSCAQLWDPLLLLRHGAPGGPTDPVFGRDAAFWLTRLPFWLNLQRLLVGLCLTAWLALYFRYVDLPAPGDPESFGDLTAICPAGRAHLSWFGAVVLLLAGWGAWLMRFSLLLTSRSRVVAGIGWTDAHVRLPFLTVLAVLAPLLAVWLLVNVRRRDLGTLGRVAGLFALAWGLYVVVPAAVQRLVVLPSEIDRERPYLERSIAATRQALGLSRAEVRQYAAGGALTRSELAAEEDTVATIPLWSSAEMAEQVIGTETLRGYYGFNPSGTDYDRYRIGGRVRQVAVAAREMQSERLDPKARNWVNQHLVFTHGYGLVMASAHEAGPAGEPIKIIRDVPPVTPPELPLTQPRLYYGELASGYVITGLRAGAATQELDYPSGDANVYRAYDGRGGVPMGGFLRKLAMALRFKSLNIVVSDLPSAAARIHFRRALYQRLHAVAPFLEYDSEPYCVLDQGRLVWLVDAYTVAGRYPYSQAYPLAPAMALGGDQPRAQGRQAAYLRNSVKVTIDAYDGTVQFHVYDAEDPLLRAYAAMFPGLFRSEPLSPTLAEHIRYPVDLFSLQARAYSRYHMTDPAVFYNAEDLWDIAREETTQRLAQPDDTYEFRSVRERMAPYYVLLRLPGESEAHFRLILPFTPASRADSTSGRDNMIGWMTADCEPASYGRLTVFHFPKNTLVYGPLQVEALIDQDPEISQQMTLWSEQGSKVLRGHLLVIPIRDTLLYVEPLYLTAERRGALPELKRVVVFYNGAVRMAETLDQALDLALSGRRSRGGAVELLRLQRQARSAANALSEAEAARRRGDLAAYGAALDQAARVIDTMLNGKGEQ